MLNSPCLYFFLIRPILEARTEIRKKFCWLFGVFKDTTISFWDFQTFNVSIPKLKDPSTSWLYYKTLTNKMFRPWFFWSYCTFDRDFLKKNQTMSFHRNCTFSCLRPQIWDCTLCLINFDQKRIRQKHYLLFINEKFKKIFYLFTCILPNY